MGKRAHGRLLHEIRATLISKGFYPKRITLLAANPEEQPREIYSAGFTLAKYRDNKSIALTHWTNPKRFRAGYGQAATRD